MHLLKHAQYIKANEEPANIHLLVHYNYVPVYKNMWLSTVVFRAYEKDK